MPKHLTFTTPYSKVYSSYAQKAERKNRTKEEVDEIIAGGRSTSQEGLQQQIELQSEFEQFFGQATVLNPNSSFIKVLWCNFSARPNDFVSASRRSSRKHSVPDRGRSLTSMAQLAEIELAFADAM